MATTQKISMKQKIEAKMAEQPSDGSQHAKERSSKRGALRHAFRVGLLVLRELERQNMSQTTLAEKMGVSRQQVTKIVKGQENFTFETIAKLEEALGVPIMTVDLPQKENSKAASAPFVVPFDHSMAPGVALTPQASLNNGIEYIISHDFGITPGANPMYAAAARNNLTVNALGIPGDDYTSGIQLSTIPMGMLQTIGLIGGIPTPLSPAGPAFVYRVDDLTASNWQARMNEAFARLNQQNGPFTKFVIAGFAVPSAVDGPQQMEDPHHTAAKAPGYKDT